MTALVEWVQRSAGQAKKTWYHSLAGRWRGWRERKEANGQPETGHVNQLIRQYSVVALGAALTRLSGQVSREEFLAFLQAFPVEENAPASRMRELFLTAYKDRSPYSQYARQLSSLYEPGHPELKKVLENLFQIAVADAPLSDKEEDFLEHVAHIFGVSPEEREMIRRRYTVVLRNPYRILGVSPQDDDMSVKRAYHRLIRNYHPDRAEALGLSQHIASQRAAEINAAYDRICKLRQTKRGGAARPTTRKTESA